MQNDPKSGTGARILAHLIRTYTDGPIFHVPGEGVLELIDALAGDEIAIDGTGKEGIDRLVTCRHENAAVTMAGVSGALRGAPGVCLVGRAPGALNAALALHSCRTDETPVLLVVGDCTFKDSGRDTMLGEELVAGMRAIAGHALYVTKVDRLEEAFAAAINAATLPRMAVGVMVVADDVWHEQADIPLPRPAPWPRIIPPDLQKAEIARLAALLQSAQRPLVVVGGGSWNDADARDLRAGLERLHIPAVAAYRFADILDHDSPCSAGELGIGADPRLLAAAGEADLVVFAGARLSELNTFASGSFEGFRLLRDEGKRTIALISADHADLFRAYPVDLALWGRPVGILSVLAQATPKADWLPWQERLRTLREEHAGIPDAADLAGEDPRALIAAIAAQQPRAKAFTVGAGRYAHLPQRHIATNRPQRYFGPKSGAMGYGLPAAIGAALTDAAGGARGRVICFAGDGCFAMSGFELATARLYDADVTCIVFNDSRFTAIAASQIRHFGREVGTDLAPIDFAAFAASMNVPARRVVSLAQYKAALTESFAASGPFLIEIPVGEDGPFTPREQAQ